MTTATILLATLLSMVGSQGPLIIEREGAPDVEIVMIDLSAPGQSRSSRRKSVAPPDYPSDVQGIRDYAEGIAPKHNDAPDAPLVVRRDRAETPKVEVLIGLKNTGAKVITAIQWEFIVIDSIRKQQTGGTLFRIQKVIVAGASQRFTRSFPFRISWDRQDRFTARIRRIEYADGSIWRRAR